MPSAAETRARPEEFAIAALALFSERGIAAVSMDDIAAGAGVTKGSLYWHFSSKKDVIVAACGQYYAAWRADIGASVAQAATARAKLEAAVRYSVRSCLLDEGNRVFTTEIVAMSLSDADIRSSWAGFLAETERFFLGLAHQAVGAGELDCADVGRAVDLMLAAMEGVKQNTLFRPRSAVPDAERRLTDDLMSLMGAARG